MAKEKGGIAVGVAAAVFYPATRLFGRRRFIGSEHIPQDGPVLLVCNHVSYLDPVYTAVYVHKRGRIPRFLAKASLWKVPVLGPILRAADQIPVYRGSANAQKSLSAADEALASGKMVVIYPEGTITRDPDGWPMHSRTGVARLAVEHCLDGKVPAIPLVHWGTDKVYDHYNKKFRPLPRKDVTVAAGPPVDLSSFRDRPSDSALLRDVTDHLMSAVRDLLAEVRGEPAPTGFFAPRRRGRAASSDDGDTP